GEDSAAVPARPDQELVLSSGMGGMMGPGGMVWTIDGRAFPRTRPIEAKVGVPLTLRIYNRDHMSMMMGHRMDHPIHVHGTRFRVLSVNGTAPDQPIWKDTVPVPLGGFVDISFVMKNPGDWMFHCHIIDHEDGGMMTFVRAR
ncbi:MAG TPA: multicopper oxidase domain-containing protein, partial [Spirochaetia bacterium]|nr:multicopper oxidase domain-containing protein [Spirochaetia bacterium]